MAPPLFSPPQPRSEMLSPDFILSWEELLSPPKAEWSPGKESGSILLLVEKSFCCRGNKEGASGFSLTCYLLLEHEDRKFLSWSTWGRDLREPTGSPFLGLEELMWVIQTWILGASHPGWPRT